MKVFLCLSVWLFRGSLAATAVGADVDAAVVAAVVGESFHGVALDASLFTPKGLYGFVDIKSSKLVTLLKGLSPGYFRVGGTFANWLFFDLDKSDSNPWEEWPFNKQLPAQKTKGWLFRPPNKLSKETFDALVKLTTDSDLRLLFDLNDEIRLPDKSWSSSQAEKLFDYCLQKGYGANIDWELGNEPNHISAHVLTEQQVGEDFLRLQQLLNQPKYAPLNGGALVGPDVGWMGVNYIRGLADVAGENLTAFTIHQYYFDGKTATLDTYMDASNFEKLQKLFDKVRDVLAGSKHSGKPIWIGETSSGYNSGTMDISDRYVSGFLCLDKLGLSALNNIQVVVRQTIYNGYYGLLDKDSLDPHPDYWLMNVHNNLVGNKVFKVTMKNSLSNTVRVYAHCTKTEKNTNLNVNYQKGAVTIFALNVGSDTVEIKLTGISVKGKVHAYVLTPEGDDVTSKTVLLNANPLLLDQNGDLPKITPVEQSDIALKAKTFGFFVLPEADVAACK